MDPLTQGVLGAVFAQIKTKGKTRGFEQSNELARAGCIGALSGMAPDLDVFIRSSSDPLLSLEFHRHFTHSLFFIPIGAMLCGIFFYWTFARRWRLSFIQVYIWSFMGFATHALLDGCTSYGTQLLWPFSSSRFSWDTVSVIDPLFTLPLLALVLWAVKTRSKHYALMGLVWGASYLGFGWFQHERVLAIAHVEAMERGYDIENIEVKPSFANLLVWKIVYTTPDTYIVDAAKAGLFGTVNIWRGESIEKLDLGRDLPWLDNDSQQAKDIERFRWFSGGFIAQDKNDPKKIIDIRYSLLPHQISALWGIKLDPLAGKDSHVRYFSNRDKPKDAVKKLWQMIIY